MPVPEKQRERAFNVGHALDELPLGRFHVLHLLHQMFAWAAFSTCQEMSPYLFTGLEQEFGLSNTQLGVFASAFQAGSIAGNLGVAWLLDNYGRRKPIGLSCFLAAACGAAMTCRLGFARMLVFRGLQAAFWSVAIAGRAIWFSEFLPARGRGPICAAYCLGWPLGRAIVISTAGGTAPEQWRALVWVSSGLMAGLGVTSLLAPESPRQLFAMGQVRQAAAVVREMYDFNREPFHEDVSVLKPEAAVKPVGGRDSTVVRIKILLHRHPGLLAYSCLLYSMLSMTSCVIDNWGPKVFQHFIFPGRDSLPHRVLFLFNLGDLLGIVASVFVADAIGRRGSFFWGFFGQALFWALFLPARAAAGGDGVPYLVALGMLASSCRCFGWEAVQLWTLEVFPTEVRATAVAVSNTLMRALSVVTLTVAGAVVAGLTPAACLLVFAAMLVVAGALSALLPVETANASMA